MKRFFIIISVLVLLFLIFNIKHVVYGVRQLSGQLSMINSSVPLSEVEEVDFSLVEEVKKFAEDSLGLNVGEAYSSYYDQKGEPVLWTLTASRKERIEPYYWSMSIAGSFPYKGFFSKELALEEKALLEEEGYDVELSEISAWSSVGFFDDPILSNMMNLSEGMLARLLIHELTHRTIYVKNQGAYNENLATVIGDFGGRQYLQSKYGEESPEVIYYDEIMEDRALFKEFMRKATKNLITYYRYVEVSGQGMPEKDRKEKIRKEVEGLKNVGFNNEKRYAHLMSDSTLNNAFFTSYLTYSNQYDSLVTIMKKDFNNELKPFLEYQIELYD